MAVTQFIESPRSPEDVAYGSSGGPEWKTYIWTGQSAKEQRQQNWVRMRHRWNVSLGIRDRTQMDAVRAFFINMRGMACGFRFKDWRDYTITDEVIGTGDGATTVFQITKTYTSGAENYVRDLLKIVDTSYLVYVDGVLQTEGGGNDYTIDINTGLITFNAAPASSLDVTVTCEFDVPVRFDTDYMNPAEDGFTTESWGSLPVIEVFDE